jgi:hypothetical protein
MQKTVSIVLIAIGTLISGCLAEEARSYEAFLEDLERLESRPPDAGDTSTEDAVEDTGDAIAVDASEDAVDEEVGPDMCSAQQAGAAIEVTFVNQTDQHADLYWVDAACTEHNQVLIRRGESADQQTYVGHVFRLKGAFSRDFLGEVEVTASQDRVVFE